MAFPCHLESAGTGSCSPGTICQRRSHTSMSLFSKPTLVVLLISGLLSSACSKKETFQVVLGADETVDAGLPVFIDTLRVGSVGRVGEEGGDRVADLVIDMGAAGDKIRKGIIRVPVGGRIQLKSDAVKDGAPPLPKGARIPTRSGLLDTIISYSNRSTLMAAGIALAAVVILYLVFRSLVGAVGLIICSAIAAVLTQAVYLHLAPWVLKVYERFPAAEGSDLGATGGQVAPAGAGMVGKAMNTVTEVMQARPDPRMVAWCLVFLVAFIVLNLVLGRVARVWRR